MTNPLAFQFYPEVDREEVESIREYFGLMRKDGLGR